MKAKLGEGFPRRDDDFIEVAVDQLLCRRFDGILQVKSVESEV
jgi:hypothetical protein